MELVEGETLRARIVDRGRLTVGESLEITAQVLEALVAAHGAGIVHRDIKPENILLDRQDTVKVADFGLARAIGTNNSSTGAALLGTVAYISPEVVTRGEADERSDLYSLGVVLFEMLTGRQPFRGEQPVHIAFQHVHEDIPAPSTLVSGIPRQLDSLITWACARTVEQRPASAADLLRAVRELSGTLPAAVLATRPEEIEPADTSDVPLPTASLDEVAADLVRGPRTFPSDLEALMSLSPDDGDGSGRAPATEGTDGDPTDGADDDGRAGDGADTGDDPAAGAETETEEDETPRRVVMRSPRARRGRHLPPGLRRRSRPMAVLACLSLVAVLLGGAWGGVDWYLSTGPGADRTVPLVTGTPLGDAEAELAASDLTVRTEERFDDSVPAGHVISAEPSTGTTLKKGSDVHLVVSKGVQTFPVPAVEGEGLEDARAEVEALGLVLVEDDPQHSETVPQGVVISQSADADALPAGGEVHVVVSQGRQPLTVPDQTGVPGDSARSTLEAAGFRVTSQEAHSGSVPKGSVISQSPASGTLFRGDTVTIVTSLGPEMVTVPDVFRKPAAEARAALEAAGFSVEVVHDKGEPVFGQVYEQTAAAGSELAKGSTVTIKVF
jgi:serine/threonine-protein kinase